jgi:hypothetical protein
VTLPALHCRREPRRPWAAGFLVFCAGIALAGCAQSPAAPERRSSSPVAAAGASVNLSGFPPEFRQGYADGCASAKGARVRDEARYRDPRYASGWRDGFDICRR